VGRFFIGKKESSVKKIFVPEHGFYAREWLSPVKKVDNTIDQNWAPISPLYWNNKKPTAAPKSRI